MINFQLHLHNALQANLCSPLYLNDWQHWDYRLQSQGAVLQLSQCLWEHTAALQSYGALIQRWPAPHNLFDKACAAFPWPVNKADYYSSTTASRNSSCIPDKFQGEVCVLNWANRRSLKGLFGISSSWVRPRHCDHSHSEDKGEAPLVQNACWSVPPSGKMSCWASGLTQK